MKRIIITLTLSIIIFLATLVVTHNYIVDKSTAAADSMVVHKMDNFRSDFDGDIIMTRNTVHSFLAAYFIAGTTADSDCFYADETLLREFQHNLKQRFASFLNANPYYQSALLILETDSTAPLNRRSYYAPILYRDSIEISNFADTYDFSQHVVVQDCRATHRSQWSLPTARSTHNLACYYVPILHRADSTFLGTFSISLEISTITDKLKAHLPYGAKDSEMLIFDNDSNIVASYPGYYERDHSYGNLRKNIGKDVTKVLEDTLQHREVILYKGAEYFQYKRPINNSDWTIVTACKTRAVYAEARRLERIVLITSLIGMTIMLLSSIVVMRQTYRTHRSKLAAEHELNTASRVQMSLLRTPTFQSPHYTLHAYLQPARQAGGDLYDYLQLGDSLVFCIGDVSGKGMPAALFMTQIVSLFRSAVRQTTDPARILDYINQVIAEDNPDMTFCTLFIGTLRQQSLTYSNAGHNLPVLLSGDGSSQFLPLASDIPVGVEPDYTYTSDTYTLQSTDTLLLYTDGITEACDSQQQLYGEKRFLAALATLTDRSPQPTVAHVLDNLTSFVGKAPQSDDITVLAIQSHSI